MNPPTLGMKVVKVKLGEGEYVPVGTTGTIVKPTGTQSSRFWVQWDLPNEHPLAYYYEQWGDDGITPITDVSDHTNALLKAFGG